MKTTIPPTGPDAFIKEAVDLNGAELEAVVRARLIKAVDDAIHEAVLMGDIKPQKPSRKKLKI